MRQRRRKITKDPSFATRNFIKPSRRFNAQRERDSLFPDYVDQMNTYKQSFNYFWVELTPEKFLALKEMLVSALSSRIMSLFTSVLGFNKIILQYK